MNNIESSCMFEREVIQPLLLNIDRFSRKNAFCIKEVFYTYKDLGECISRIRSAVKKLDQDNLHIGLVANDDLETYASIFALWLEGKAYVPLHPKHPLDRSEEIINGINITGVLDSGNRSLLSNYPVIHTGSLLYEKNELSNDHLADDECLVYVLFTSGSTGVPKGVMISRKNIGAFMDSFWESGIVINEDDKCLQCFDLTFDVSVQSFLAPLVKGACVYTIPHEEIKYSYCYGLLEDHQLTFCAFAPSMLRYLKPYFEEISLPAIKYCIFTAEASPIDLIQSWGKCVPNALLYDFYGPTETTIYCTYYLIQRNETIKTLNGMISIGRPMKNVATIIVDENDHIISKGEKGELCVTGAQVTNGYWDNPGKNEEVFLKKEYKGTLTQFYRTGDLCFYDGDDHIMLYGRKDSQAKIQGYRVDLGELEYHARKFLNGANAVVMTFINSMGNTELALFAEGANIDPAALADYMKTKIPLYFMPSKILLESEFVLNTNSKVDKIKLREKLDEDLKKNPGYHGN
jgi:D-alanine--poly(phosphoribitol) ligase subunit 1